MKKRTFLITGATQGIGKATALNLANGDSQIAVTYARNKTKAEEVVSQLEGKGAKAIALQLNLHNQKEVNNIFYKIQEILGKVDVLISNAFGKSIFKPLHLIEDEEYEETFSTVKGTFLLLQNAAEHLADHGTILVTSSGATAMPVPAGGLYAAAKSAIEQFALSLSKELGERDINVNVILPGVTNTESLVAPKEIIDQLIAQTPLGRLGRPDDVANAMARLTSPENKWINMQKIGINGGIL
ncbi:SDR family oxidoreductase [Ulvibacterium sp.]|uniref:SDR family oxidoreductase n=1 Tax=Ulvibacterium sp. TaxID=2665914 RepID=UPI003CC6604B